MAAQIGAEGHNQAGGCAPLCRSCGPDVLCYWQSNTKQVAMLQLTQSHVSATLTAPGNIHLGGGELVWDATVVVRPPGLITFESYQAWYTRMGRSRFSQCRVAG